MEAPGSEEGISIFFLVGLTDNRFVFRCIGSGRVFLKVTAVLIEMLLALALMGCLTISPIECRCSVRPCCSNPGV